MPRVPILEPSVALRQMPGYQPARVEADRSMANAINGLGADIKAVADGVEKARDESKKAAREAEAVVEADAMLQLDRLNAESLAEFRKKKGLTASADSAEAADQLEKHRQEVAKGIASPEARNRFLVRSSELTMHTRRQVEAHTGSEFEAARTATVAARRKQAVGMAEAGVADFGAWLAVEREVKADITANARTPEEALANIAEFESESSAALAAGLVAQGRVAEATEYVASSRERLGGRYVETKSIIDRAAAGAQKDKLVAETAKLVDTTAESLRQEGDGFIKEEELRRGVDLEEADPEVRAELQQALERRIALEQRRLHEAINEKRNDVDLADLDGRPIPGEAELFLRKYDARYLLARDARFAAEARSRRAEARAAARPDDAASKAALAAERRRQKELDAEYIAVLNRRIVQADDPTTIDPNEVMVDFIADKADEGEEVRVTSLARSVGELHAAKAVKKTQTEEGRAELRAEAHFLAGIETQIRSTVKVKNKADESRVSALVGDAARLYEERLAENGGKPLDPTQLGELRAQMLRREKEGWFSRTQLGVEVDAAKLPKQKPVMVRFPDGQVFPVEPEKLQQAKKKGGVVIDG